MNKTKSVYQYLLTIPGFGPTRAKQLLASIGIAQSTKFNTDKKLPVFKETLLLQALASLRKSSSWTKYNSTACEFEIEKILLKNKQDFIKNYISNLSYRGGRLKFGYPVNGGRTRSNARTAKRLLTNPLLNTPKTILKK